MKTELEVIPGRIYQRKYRSDLENRNEKTDSNTVKINLKKNFKWESIFKRLGGKHVLYCAW